MIKLKITNNGDFSYLRNLKMGFYHMLTIGLLLLPQISFAQALVVRPNDATSKHTMVEPQATFFGAFFGYQAGNQNLGCCNTFIGAEAGRFNTTGIENTFLGTGAGEQNVTGSGNTYLGRFAGRLSTGSRNVFLGTGAGYGELGNDQLFIDNGGTTTPLLHGFFAKDSLVINGDLEVKGDLIIESIDASQTAVNIKNGYSAWLPEVLDNSVTVEISSLFFDEKVLITRPIGFEIDTFTLPPKYTHVGFSQEFPFTFETDNPAVISAMNNWFNNPSAKVVTIIIKDVAGFETSRIDMYEYSPGTSGPGKLGRTAYTLFHGQINNSVIQNQDIIAYNNVEIPEYKGSTHSFDPSTDKIVEINGITHADFTPAVQIDYVNRVITLETTYNEGAGLITWIDDVSKGELGQNKTVIIHETTDGTTPISTESFSEVLPFKYEIIYGFGLNTKIVARMQLFYGCVGPCP